MTVAAIANKLGANPAAQNTAAPQPAPADGKPYFEMQLSQARQSVGRGLRKSNSVRPNKPSGVDVRAAGRRPKERGGAEQVKTEHASATQAETPNASPNADSPREHHERPETTKPLAKSGDHSPDRPVEADLDSDADSQLDTLDDVATQVVDSGNPVLTAQAYAAAQEANSDVNVEELPATGEGTAQPFESQADLGNSNPLPANASAPSAAGVPVKVTRGGHSDPAGETVGVETTDSTESETAKQVSASGEAIVAAGEGKAGQNNGGDTRDERGGDKPEVTRIGPKPTGESRREDAAEQLDRLLNLNSPGSAAPAGHRTHDAPQPAAAPTTHAEQAAESQDPNVARVARGLQNAVQQQGGSVTLRLTPPDLGFVKIQMDIQNGVANVQFQTEQESVRTLLTHQLSNLKQALETHGLTVQKLDVQTIPMGTFSNGQQADNSASDGRSRGQFFNRQQQEGSGNDSRQPNDEPASFAQSVMNMLGLAEAR